MDALFSTLAALPALCWLTTYSAAPCPPCARAAQEEEQRGESEIEEKAADLQTAIAEGAVSFLFTEYKFVGIFMVREALTAR